MQRNQQQNGQTQECQSAAQLFLLSAQPSSHHPFMVVQHISQFLRSCRLLVFLRVCACVLLPVCIVPVSCECLLPPLRSGCDCTNSCLLEHHLQVQLSHQFCLHQFLPVAQGPVEEPPVWTNTCTGSPLRQGRPVMLRDSRSGVLTSLAHSSAESLVCFFHLGLEPRHRLFFRSHSQHSGIGVRLFGACGDFHPFVQPPRL